jgi:hypothetical protein
MDKYELSELMKFMAKEMYDYSQIRAGGNLGTAIQGFLNLKASENIERGLNKIAVEIKELKDALPKKKSGKI